MNQHETFETIGRLNNKDYDYRQKNNNMFSAWQRIEGHNTKFREFENLDREVMPDGRPVPIIRNDTEKSRAEIVYSDGSETMEEIVEVLNKPAKKYFEVVNR